MKETWAVRKMHFSTYWSFVCLFLMAKPKFSGDIIILMANTWMVSLCSLFSCSKRTTLEVTFLFRVALLIQSCQLLADDNSPSQKTCISGKYFLKQEFTWVCKRQASQYWRKRNDREIDILFEDGSIAKTSWWNVTDSYFSLSPWQRKIKDGIQYKVNIMHAKIQVKQTAFWQETLIIMKKPEKSKYFLCHSVE